MALLEIGAYSNVLEMEVSFNVLLPQATKKTVGTATRGVIEDIPVLYLLHGMGQNHSIWLRKSSIERYASHHEIAVVMPSTDLGFYTDTTYDMKYWQYISEELPKIVHEFFPQITYKREKTFAAGLSMGGYGAVKLGLLKPDNFAAVASLSGAVYFNDIENFLAVRDAAYWEGVLGPFDQFMTSKNNPSQMLKDFIASGKMSPRFFLACGTEDGLHPASQYMAHKMRQAEMPVTFEDGPGQHDWVFWDQWIQRVLVWMLEEKPGEN